MTQDIQTDSATLQVLAAVEKCSSDALWLDNGICWLAASDGSLRTVCAVGTPHWNAAELTAKILTTAKKSNKIK